MPVISKKYGNTPEVTRFYKVSIPLHFNFKNSIFCTILQTSPLLFIRDAVFTVSPKKQYLGHLCPMTPATAGPV